MRCLNGQFPMQPDEIAEALAMLANGHTREEVCAWIGCTPRQLSSIAPKHRRSPTIAAQRRHAQARNESIRTAISAGASPSEIYERFGINKNQLSGLRSRARKAIAKSNVRPVDAELEQQLLRDWRRQQALEALSGTGSA